MKKYLLALLNLVFLISIVCTVSCNKETNEAAPARLDKSFFMPKIAAVYDPSVYDSNIYGKMAFDSLALLADDLGGFLKGYPELDKGKNSEFRLLSAKHGKDEYQQLLRSLTEENFNLVFCLGSCFSDVANKIADDFPNTCIVLLDAKPETEYSKNLLTVSFADNEAAFIMGVCAGLISKDVSPDAKVGYIATSANPLSQKIFYAYQAGAIYVNKNLKQNFRIMNSYSSSDVDKKAKEKSENTRLENAAKLMFKQKTAVILNNTESSCEYVIKVATEANSFVLGYGINQADFIFSKTNNLLYAKTVKTSIEKRIDRVIYSLSRELCSSNKIDRGSKVFGLADRGIDYVVNDIPISIETTLSEISKLIVSGAISIPYDAISLSEFVQKLN